MRTLTVILSLICMVFTANAARADRRVAFVVGNGAYKNVAQLPNPPVDAKAMAGVLRNVGFEVVEDNIQPYVGVNQSIDEQNYQIVASSSTSTSSLFDTVTTACPNTGAQNMTVAGVSVGVVHQDCRSLNPNRATECPAASP